MMAGARIRIEIDDAQARAALGFPRTRGDRPCDFFLRRILARLRPAAGSPTPRSPTPSSGPAMAADTGTSPAA